MRPSHMTKINFEVTPLFYIFTQAIRTTNDKNTGFCFSDDFIFYGFIENEATMLGP